MQSRKETQSANDTSRYRKKQIINGNLYITLRTWVIKEAQSQKPRWFFFVCLFVFLNGASDWETTASYSLT